MSKIKIQGDSGGTGVFTLTSPNSNTDRTITLPDDAGTIVTSAASDASGYSWLIDEDNMASDLATKVPSQQSVKAYVDAQIGAENTLAEDNDVNITSAADGSMLLYDTGTSMWIDNVMSGDATMTDGGVITLGADVIDGSHLADNAVNSEHITAGSIDTAHIAADQITGALIADDQINSEHYVDGSIDTAHIAADQITSALIADDQIDSEHLVDGSIDTAHIGDAQVTTAKIAADNITGALIADDQINSEHYVDGSIDTAHIADSQVTLAKIADAAANTVLVRDANSSGVLSAKAVADTQILIGDGTGFTAASLTGDVTMTNAGVTNIAADVITGAEIADDSINSEHYVDASIDTQHIAADQITNALMADDAIDSAQIADGAVDLVHMSADSVDGSKIADDSINSEHYVDGSIDTAHIAADQITNALIADAQIDSEHLVAGSVDNSHLSGSIANAKLANSTITVSDGSNSTATALGGTVTFAGTANEVTVAESSGTITVGLPDNVTIAGNLTVSGTNTSVSSTTIEVADPLLSLATNNGSADAVDIGLYGLYDTSGSQDLYGGLFRDASDSGKWKIFKDNQAEPTTTVNTSGTGYAVGTLVANLEGDVTGAITGNADTATLATTVTITANNSTDETVYPVFVDGATGTQGLESDTGLAYNPSSGNLTIGGTVDGRDLATDGSKLDGIESGATADQTNAEIRAAVEAASDSNVFTDADHTKLDGIESSATADQTDAEIRAAVEAASDSNVFTDADHTKLDGIEASATADQTDAEIRAAVEAATDSNVFTDADHSKLNAIEASATADQTAAEILTAIKTVDGAASGLDADLLDGQHGSHYRIDIYNAAGTLLN
jgi:hypothetical protein